MVAALVGTFAVAAAIAMPAAGAPDPVRHATSRSGSGQIFFTPAAADPKLAALIARTGIGGAPFRFTPADSRGGHRIASIALPSIATREVNSRNLPALPAVGVAPIAYSLGAPAAKRVTITDLKVDLGTTPGVRRIVDIGATMSAGTKRSKLKALTEPTREDARLAGTVNNMIDVGGSYSLSRNLDVTAGVRYKSQDRDRLAPLPDGQRDSQAVYVGTAFRF